MCPQQQPFSQRLSPAFSAAASFQLSVPEIVNSIFFFVLRICFQVLVVPFVAALFLHEPSVIH